MIKSVASSFEISSTDRALLPDFNHWLTDFAYCALPLPGFFSAEIIPPQSLDASDSTVWSVIHRFESDATARTWSDSSERRAQLDRLATICEGQVRECPVSAALSEHHSAIVAIETYVAPGKEEEYYQWKRQLEATQSSLSGYRGSYLQAPVSGRDHYWSSILRFSGTEALEHWLHSPDRLALVAQNKEFQAATRLQIIGSTFPGWEPSIAGKSLTPPWKTACLVVMALYPLLVIQRHYLVPLLSGLNPALAVAITTICSVVLVSFVCMPRLVKFFTWWLLPAEINRTAIEKKGALTILSIFIFEVCILDYLMIVLK